MKRLFLLLLIGISSHFAYPQEAKIHLRSDTTLTAQLVSDKLVASSDELIYGELSDYRYENIIAIHFFSKPSPILVAKLQEEGISVVNRYSDDALYPESILKNERKQRSVDLMLHHAFNEKQIGSTLQIIGIGAISAAFIVEYAEFKKTNVTLDDLEKRKNVLKGLAIGGGFVFFVGTTISLSADRKIVSSLKIR